MTTRQPKSSPRPPPPRRVSESTSGLDAVPPVEARILPEAIEAGAWSMVRDELRSWGARAGVSFDGPYWHPIKILARAVRSGQSRAEVQAIVRELDLDLDVVDCATIGFLDRVQDYFAAHPDGLGDDDLIRELVVACLTVNQLETLDWIVASVTVPIDWGATVFPALFSGQATALDYAIRQGANVDASQNATGMTALHHQCKHGRTRLVPELLAHGADPNCEDAHGHTPLHAVAKGVGKELIELLLEAGANPSLTDRDGRTPLDLARAATRQTAYRVLRARTES